VLHHSEFSSWMIVVALPCGRCVETGSEAHLSSGYCGQGGQSVRQWRQCLGHSVSDPHLAAERESVCVCVTRAFILWNCFLHSRQRQGRCGRRDPSCRCPSRGFEDPRSNPGQRVMTACDWTGSVLPSVVRGCSEARRSVFKLYCENKPLFTVTKINRLTAV
jgi:hypothetical protein